VSRPFAVHVLLAVHQLQGNGHAVSIADEIGRREGRSILLGTVWATLDRLERRGLVMSRLDGTRDAVRGGRPKRLYRVTKAGLLAISEGYEAERRRWEQTVPMASRRNARRTINGN
jgi:DNA-binding PadR family transcriptional regulator